MPVRNDTVMLPAQVRRAEMAPATLDTGARTIEVVWTTGAAVRRADWDTGETYVEELSVEPGAVRIDRLNEGAPFLRDHGAWNVDNVLGSVVPGSVRLEDGRGIARIRLADDPEAEKVWRKIEAGHIRSVSIGYTVNRFQVEERDGAPDIYRAVDWEPFEISAVAVGADPGAGFRSGSPVHPVTMERAMTDKTEAAQVAAEGARETAAPVKDVRTAPDEAAIRAEAVKAERARGAEITALVTRAKLPQDLAAKLIADGVSVEQARAKVLDALVEQQSDAVTIPGAARSSVEVGISHDDPATVLNAMATAIAARAMPSVREKAGDGKWRSFAGMKPSEMLIELAQARGERVGPRDRIALQSRAFHTTSDFPKLLANAANKMLMAGYALAQPSYRTFFARRSFNDFKAHSFLTAGDFPALAELAEGGEITLGTVSEKREQVTPKTHARGLTITRQMLVNDDLGAFGDFGAMIGRRVADYENALAYALVNTATGDGPTLEEGSAAVFTTGRGNKAGTAAAVTAASLGVGYNAMMGATSLDGLKLNLQPRYLVCSLAQRFAAAQLANSAIQPSSSAEVNPFAGTFQVVADANIPSNRWYLFADPAAAPVYIYGYVNDAEGPMIRQGEVMGYDGFRLDVVMDFGVGAVDWRGGFYNSGVAPA